MQLSFHRCISCLCSVTLFLLTAASAQSTTTTLGIFKDHVCSHDKNVTKRAIFSNVHLVSLPTATGKPILYSALETIAIASTDRLVAYVAPTHFEAPNWSHDGSFFLFNSEGRIQRLGLNESEPTPVTTDHQNRCNNDHGMSPDGHTVLRSPISNSRTEG